MHCLSPSAATLFVFYPQSRASNVLQSGQNRWDAVGDDIPMLPRRDWEGPARATVNNGTNPTTLSCIYRVSRLPKTHGACFQALFIDGDFCRRSGLQSPRTRSLCAGQTLRAPVGDYFLWYRGHCFHSIAFPPSHSAFLLPWTLSTIPTHYLDAQFHRHSKTFPRFGVNSSQPQGQECVRRGRLGERH